MAFFGSAPSTAAAPSFSPAPATSNNPVFEEAPKTTSNPLFSSASSTSGPNFSEAPAKSSVPFFGASSGGLSGSVSAEGDDEDADDALSGYHFLTVTPGEDYTIRALREELDLDPAMWVFSGHSTYEDFQKSGELVGGDQFDDGMSSYLGDADDEIDVEDGPWGDPEIVITAPESGRVTVVITNYLSDGDDGGDGRFDYRLEVEGPDISFAGDTPFFSAMPKTATSPFFGAASTVSANPFFNPAPTVSENPFFNNEDSITITFDEDNFSDINNKIFVDGGGVIAVIDEEAAIPVDGGEPPYLVLLSNGEFLGPKGELLGSGNFESPFRQGIDELQEEVGGTFTSGSGLLIGFAATGETQAVTFESVLTAPEFGPREGGDTNSVAFYLTLGGDGGVIGQTDSLLEGEAPGWQINSVDLDAVSAPDTDQDVMLMLIGVAQVNGQSYTPRRVEEPGIDNDGYFPWQPDAALLVDNITLVGVTLDDLGDLPEMSQPD